MTRLSSFFGGCAILCAVIYIIGAGIRFTTFVPWEEIFNALPIICMVFILIAFGASSLAEKKDGE